MEQNQRKRRRRRRRRNRRYILKQRLIRGMYGMVLAIGCIVVLSHGRAERRHIVQNLNHPCTVMRCIRKTSMLFRSAREFPGHLPENMELIRRR